MKRVRASLAALITVCGLLLVGMKVVTADDRGLEIALSDAFVRDGDEIGLTAALTGYGDLDKGVNAVMGTLEYDRDVFRKIGEQDFETLNSWEKLFYNPESGRFVLIKKAGSRADEAIFRVKMQADEQIPARETYIAVKDISLSEGKEDIWPEDISEKIQSIAAADGGDTGPEEPESPEEPETPETPEEPESPEEPETPEDNGSGAEEPGESRRQRRCPDRRCRSRSLPVYGCCPGSGAGWGICSVYQEKEGAAPWKRDKDSYRTCHMRNCRCTSCRERLRIPGQRGSEWRRSG